MASTCRPFKSADSTSLLPKKTINVLLATPLGRNGKGGIDRLNDSIIASLKSEPKFSVSRLVTRGDGGLFAAQFTFAYALIRFLFLAAMRRADLLHIHLSIRGSSYRKSILGAAARLMGVPYIVHLHGIDYREFWSSTHPAIGRAIDELFNHSQRIIVMGRFWADVITDRLPHVAENIVTIPNASPISNLSFVPAVDDRVRITFLGKLGARKGTPHLIAALGRLSHRKDWTATIAGDGEVTESRDAVHQLGIDQRVEIPGWLEVGQRDQLLRRTDILVLPSLAENLPMVIVEAFALGIPVISTPVGAIPEVIHDGRNGLLVPVGNDLKLADALELLIRDPAYRHRISNAAKSDYAKRYNFDVYMNRLKSTWFQSMQSAA